MSNLKLHKSVTEFEKNNENAQNMGCEIEAEDLIASELVFDATLKEDDVEKTFSSTSIGKNIIELKRCHVTIEKLYYEMMARIEKMEEQFKKQPSMSMIVQEGVKLFKNNTHKLKIIKGKQVREALAKEMEFKQYISAENPRMLYLLRNGAEKDRTRSKEDFRLL